MFISIKIEIGSLSNTHLLFHYEDELADKEAAAVTVRGQTNNADALKQYVET